jgi:hypothetical protein
MPSSRDEGRSRDIAGDDRVDRVRCAIDEVFASAEQFGQRSLERASGDFERVDHAADWIPRCRGRLEHMQIAPIVLDDQIRESPSGVDAEPHMPMALNAFWQT